MPEGTTLTVHLSAEAEARLAHLARRTRRSQDTLVTEAIENFLLRETRDVAAIETALVEMRTATLIPHDAAMDQLDAAIEDVIASRACPTSSVTPSPPRRTAANGSSFCA